MKEINQTTLLDLAGKAAYQRGEAYYRDDRVGDLRINGNSIVAEVEGTEVYRVKLKHTLKVFEGSCDCPASDNFDFCKHCVATGLKYIAQQQTQETLRDSKGKDLLKNYLMSLEKSELATQLESLITYDKLLHDEWTLKAEVAAGVLDHKAFKKRITKAIPYNRDLYRYAQVRDYFSRVELVVDTLAEFLPSFKPDEALALVDYALQRVSKALETIDDSGGFRFYSVETLNDLHIQAMEKIRWPLEKIVAYLKDIYFGQDDELYPAIPGNYMDILGEEGLDLFNAEFQSRWDNLPPLINEVKGDSDWEIRSQYYDIQRPLLVAAEVSGNVDAQLELLAKTATREHDFVALSKLCLSHDRLSEAIDWLQQAQRLDKGNSHRFQDSSIIEQEVAILCYQDKFDEVLQLRWAHYQRHPSLHNFQRVQEMAKKAEDNRNWYQMAMLHLQSLIKQDSRQVYYDLIAELHLDQSHPELALDLAQQQKLRPDILLAVVRANPDSSEQILPLYIRLAEFDVNQGNNKAYHNAISLLQEAQTVMSEALPDQLLNEIKRLSIQYKAKRNFRKWLGEAFPALG